MIENREKNRQQLFELSDTTDNFKDELFPQLCQL
jgi:hypothetical protein